MFDVETSRASFDADGPSGENRRSDPKGPILFAAYRAGRAGCRDLRSHGRQSFVKQPGRSCSRAETLGVLKQSGKIIVRVSKKLMARLSFGTSSITRFSFRNRTPIWCFHLIGTVYDKSCGDDLTAPNPIKIQITLS